MTTTESRPGSEIAPGSVVVVRDEEWLVTATDQTTDGLLVRVQGLSELVRDTTATFYDSLDTIEALDPRQARVVADDSPRYRRSRLWLESTFRKTPIPLADPSLSVSTQALADPLSYQQTAVRKALDPANLRPRILLADAVGLGKTLEIGMILSELARRGRGDRILIVTPKHVLEQMQHEMWTRFALPFVRLDSAGIQRVRQKLPATRNPFTYFKRAIISIDTLKSERYLAGLRKQRWDAVVIDESHKLSNSATLNNRLARILARTTESLILASATPHNGKKESFAELIRLLDPSAVRPDGTLIPEEVERLVIRRHRHSPEVAGVVGADWVERADPLNILVDPSPAEDAIADELEHTWLFPQGTTPYSGTNASLFPWTLAKAFLSSPAALEETISARRKKIEKDASAAREVEALDRLAGLTATALKSPSRKYERLVEYLRSIGVGAGSSTRVVIFAERLRTIGWLAANLPKSLKMPKDAVQVMHGGLSDDEQQRIVDEFKQAGAPVRVLVTGDVASEGVNLHTQCHHLVHYDIPWSLIRIEQRNGRIDRYGQRSTPQITTLLLDPSSEKFAGHVRILSRLVEKEHEAHGALGDAASLMGQYSEAKEEEEIRKVLAGTKRLDDVVRSVDEVATGSDLTALFAQLFNTNSASTESVAEAPAVSEGSGLYPDQVSYLEEALREAFIDPSAQPSNAGVAWRREPAFGTAELVPPRDLVQRLEVLPQSYLTDRAVTRKLVLATTSARGKDRLQAALSDESGSSWPDAHYLGPLHPVLEWASDRALGKLGRNEVFAVRAPVDDVSVLLLGTLTNRRGQVVAAAWMTAEFPRLDNPDFCTVVPHESLRAALDAVGFRESRTNPGTLVDVQRLDALIPPAVAQARSQMRLLLASAETDVKKRVAAWTRRLGDWDVEAGALIQRKDVQTRRLGVQEEREMVEAMNPDRQLVRPLLVVVPEDHS